MSLVHIESTPSFNHVASAANGVSTDHPRPRASASTVAIHGGQRPDAATGSIVTPIHQTSTYVQRAVGQPCGGGAGFTYSRASNPTVSVLEEALGELDAPRSGQPLPAVCFATGLAAVSTLFLALLKAGDHVIIGEVVYGGTVRLARDILSHLGMEVTFADTSNPESLRGLIRAKTKLVFIETPANPTLVLTDIAAIAKVTSEAGIPLAVDNTFLTPVLQKCFDLGADVCVYSTTKHIEGHNSVIGGAITARDPALLDRLRFVRKTLGNIAAPFDAWLTIRGLKTLPLRIAQHSRAALAVAYWLEKDPRIAKVSYPGLESHPQHALATSQHEGNLHGGVLSFEVRGGASAGIALMNNLRLCSLAESLGSVETLITHPVSMTHGDVPKAQREKTGITDGLVRLSVGLEDPNDIIADLDQALAIAVPAVLAKPLAPVEVEVKRRSVGWI